MSPNPVQVELTPGAPQQPKPVKKPVVKKTTTVAKPKPKTPTAQAPAPGTPQATQQQAAPAPWPSNPPPARQ